MGRVLDLSGTLCHSPNAAHGIIHPGCRYIAIYYTASQAAVMDTGADNNTSCKALPGRSLRAAHMDAPSSERPCGPTQPRATSPLALSPPPRSRLPAGRFPVITEDRACAAARTLHLWTANFPPLPVTEFCTTLSSAALTLPLKFEFAGSAHVTMRMR